MGSKLDQDSYSLFFHEESTISIREILLTNKQTIALGGQLNAYFAKLLQNTLLIIFCLQTTYLLIGPYLKDLIDFCVKNQEY